jgi:hypothetical protein
MPLIYRSMLADGEKPKAGGERGCLGVRVPPDKHADIPVAADGTVAPITGGMSVSPSLASLPFFLIPRRLLPRFPRATGSNQLICWRMGGGSFEGGSVTAGLVLRPDPDKPLQHGFVEPETVMPLDQYQQALAATRDVWVKAEE